MASLLLVIIYLSFISLGLPDSLLGSAWPVLHAEINVPVSLAGVISIIISVGTIISSFFSDKLNRKFGSGKIIAISVFMTAAALFGFSISNKFWMLALWSIPYGLGAGAVDSVLNNYVALHYKAQHMSWLHCMWGLGASVSPYIMSFSLVKLDSWNYGYLIVSIIQMVLSAAIFISLPLWKRSTKGKDEKEESPVKPLSFKEIFKTKGALPCFLAFFAYCAFEVTASLWASTYLSGVWDFSPEMAAGFASLFYIGITVGRLFNGFLAIKLSDKVLIRTGLGIIAVGIILIFIPLHSAFSVIGFIVAGLGCAPIYPCIIHMTPDIFGREKSQAIIGVQMAFAYIGFLTMPPLFGLIADFSSISLLPLFLLLLLVTMAVMHEITIKKAKSYKD